MADLSQIAPNGVIQLYSGVSSLPALTAFTDGAALTAFETGQVIRQSGQPAVRALPRSALLYLRSEGASSTIPGPVKVFAGRGNVWYAAGALTDFAGAVLVQVVLTPNGEGSHMERLSIGAGWERLALVAAGAVQGDPISVDLVREVKI
jgi:hypothetical protein